MTTYFGYRLSIMGPATCWKGDKPINVTGKDPHVQMHVLSDSEEELDLKELKVRYPFVNHTGE